MGRPCLRTGATYMGGVFYTGGTYTGCLSLHRGYHLFKGRGLPPHWGHLHRQRVCLYTGGQLRGVGEVYLYTGVLPTAGGGGVCELSLTLGNAYTGRGVCLPQGSPRARPPAPGAPAHGGSPGARAGRRPHLVAEDLVEGGPGPAQGAEEGEPEPERAVVARLQQHHLRHDQRRVPHVAAELRRHRPPATARRKWRPPPPGSSAP